MAAITTAQAKDIQRDLWQFRALAKKYPGLGSIWTNFDATTGAITVTVADTVAGTNATAFRVGATSGTTPRIGLAENTGKTGNYQLTVKPGTLAANRNVLFPDSIGAEDVIVTQAMTQTLVNKTLTTPTIGDFTNATHDHSNAAGGGTITTAVVGTTGNTFDIDSDNATGVLRLQTTIGGTDHTITLTNSTTTAARTLTLPDLTGTIALVGVTGQKNYIEMDGSTSGGIKIAPIATGTAVATIVNQNVAASTITLPSATCTLAGLGLANIWTADNTFASITGNDASLGVAGTPGAAGGAGGIVAVVGGLGDTNGAGGAITVIGGGGAGTGAGGATTLKGGDSGTGSTGNGGAATVQGGAATSTAGAGGAVAVTGGLGTTTGAGGAITITAGAGGTTGDGGAITITSGASGGASDTAGLVAIDTGSKTGGTDASITIGGTNALGVNIGRATKTTTITGLGIIAETDTATNSVTDVLTLNHTGGTPAAGLGTGISFGIEDAGGLEEQGSIDFSLATATNLAEDCDFILSLNLNGTITQAFKIDSINQKAVIGVASDADSIASLQIFPASASARGSLILACATHASADYACTITQATDLTSAQTITIPNCGDTADTFALLDTAQTFGAVKTFTAAPVVQITDAATTTVTDVATFTHLGGTPAAGLGLGLSFIVENAADGTTQVSSIDFVNTNASCTKASLDTDIIFSTMLAGTVTPALTIDASAQELVIGQDATDANGMHALRIWPLTAAMGSILIQPTDNTGDDTITITNGNTGGDITITLPTVTSTLAILGANTFTGTQTVQAITAGSGAYAYDFSASSGAFTTSTGTNTLSGDVTVAAAKSITMSGAGTFTTGTGAVALMGDVTVKGGITTATATGMTIAAATATSLALGSSGITTSVLGAFALSGTVATAMTLSGTNATASISITGTSAIGMYMTGPNVTRGIVIGVEEFGAAGTGIVVDGVTLHSGCEFYFDDGGVKLAAGYTEAFRAGYLVSIAITDADVSVYTSHDYIYLAASVTTSGGVGATWASLLAKTGATLTTSSGVCDFSAFNASCDVPSGAEIGAGTFVAGISMGGNLGGTHTGKAVAFRVRTPSAGAWDGLFDVPTALSSDTVGAGALVYVPCYINGVAAKLHANWTSA